MQVQTATALILFSLLQLYAVILAVALPATAPSQIHNNLLTPNLAVPYNLTYRINSSSNVLPPDPSYEAAMTSTVKFYDYGVPLPHVETIVSLTALRQICMSHYPALSEFVRTPHKITVANVELQIYPSAQLTWRTLLVAEHLLELWLEHYEYTTLQFTQWENDGTIVATGNLSLIGGE